MQFMLIRNGDQADGAVAPPPRAVLDDLLRRLADADLGRPALAVAFALDDEAVRLSLRPDGDTVTAGPFAPGERLPAGLAVFEAASHMAARRVLNATLHSSDPPAATITLELRETGCAGGCAGIVPGALGDGACYAILLRADAATERDAIPAQAKLDRLNAFNAAEAAAGTLLAGDGLKRSGLGARLAVRDGRASFIDGPFAEAKELIAGFWMVRAASRAHALAWARTLPYPTGPEVEVEIRRVAALAGPSGVVADLPRDADVAAKPVDPVRPIDPNEPADAQPDLRADASLRAEGLDAALRAELAPRAAWNRP